MIPPVTMFAVPIVRRTKPQKIPACISPARGVLEHLRLDERVLDSPANRRGDRRRTGAAARRRAGPPRRRGGGGPSRGRRRRRAPEHDEDERVGRDIGEDREHQLALVRPTAGRLRRSRSAGPAGSRRGRAARRASRGRGRGRRRSPRATPRRPSGCRRVHDQASARGRRRPPRLRTRTASSPGPRPASPRRGPAPRSR